MFFPNCGHTARMIHNCASSSATVTTQDSTVISQNLMHRFPRGKPQGTRRSASLVVGRYGCLEEQASTKLNKTREAERAGDLAARTRIHCKVRSVELWMIERV